MVFNLKLPSPPPFATALSNAQSNVESVYGLGSGPATIFPSYIGAAEGTDAGNLGLILGAIINEDQHLCPSAPGGLVAALSLDLEDGVFNGAFPPGCDCASSPVPYCGGFLPEIAGTSDFQDALSGLAQAQLVTAPFAFGGTGNVLTANGLANLATGGSTAYPIAPLATINQALLNAAPFLSDS